MISCNVDKSKSESVSKSRFESVSELISKSESDESSSEKHLRIVSMSYFFTFNLFFILISNSSLSNSS